MISQEDRDAPGPPGTESLELGRLRRLQDQLQRLSAAAEALLLQALAFLQYSSSVVSVLIAAAPLRCR